MLALIDADFLIYSAGFAAQKKAWSVEMDGETLCVLHKKKDAFALADDVDGAVVECSVLKPAAIACWYADKLVQGILDNTDPTNYQLYLSPETTFRNSVKTYKANRVSPKPLHFHTVRDHLISKWEAVVCEGIEADDMLSILGWKAWKGEEALPLMVHVDKDIDQVPGFHYNPKKNEEYYLTEYQADYNFWKQMLMGDTVDGIQGIPGCGEVKARKILDESEDWGKDVLEIYQLARQNFYENYFLLRLLEE